MLTQFPPRSVAAWLGHDVSVLLEYYAIIKSEDFAGARNFRAQLRSFSPVVEHMSIASVVYE